MRTTFQDFIPSHQPPEPEQAYTEHVQSRSVTSADHADSGDASSVEDEGPAEESSEPEHKDRDRKERQQDASAEQPKEQGGWSDLLFSRWRLSRLFSSEDGAFNGASLQPLQREASARAPYSASAGGTQPRFGRSREASHLTDDQREIIDLTSRLPDGFPVDDWDGMSARRQLRTIRHSDLDEQEQWRVLNATTSLKTLAAIGDIQRNRSAYGLSEKRANDVTDALLRIANARQGVHNRDIDFHSDNQRNLFLRTLEEQEEGLLGSLGIVRQNGSVQEKHANNLGMQNEMWYDNKNPSIPSDSGMSKGINEYPAISDMLGGKEASPQQRTVLQQAQADLDALYNSGADVTQQDIDTILADACTQLLNDENRDALEMYGREQGKDGAWRPVSELAQTQVDAYTEKIDRLFDAVDEWAQGYDAASSKMWDKIKQYNMDGNITIDLQNTKALDFANRVRENGIWDVKTVESWEKSVLGLKAGESSGIDYFSSSHRFVYRGELINAQELGNMLYGYAGAAIGFSDETLYRAGGIVHWLTGGEDSAWASPYYGDSTEDHAFTQKGVLLYYGGR